jgi:ubiquinone/menaquinone biosynthesis C-methylase UbiE
MKRLVPAVDLRAGQTVADIGAGGGELTFALAKEVGATGRVYATEIDESRLERLRRRAADDGHANVTVLEAHATRTNLPPACCDVVVIRNVYHHFEDTKAMNRSVFESVKPGGRLAIIDFEPRRGGDHGVESDTVTNELAAAGFEQVMADTDNPRSFMVVVRRPN